MRIIAFLGDRMAGNIEGLAAVVLAAGLLFLPAPSLAAPATNAGRAVSAVPDFTGIWGKSSFGYPVPYADGPGDDFSVVGGFDSPLLKPWTVEFLQRTVAYNKSGHIFPDAASACWPGGVPGIFNFRHIQILQTPAQMTIFYKSNNQTRTVYLNQRHALKIAPSWYGESVGRWEGDTLVVDTVGFRRRPEAIIDDYGTPATEGLHVVERYRYHEGPTVGEPPPRPVTGDFPGRFILDYKSKIIQVVYTVEDPNTFKKPWSGTLYFRPVVKPAELEETICPANNRDWVRLIPTAQTPDF